MSLFVLQKDLSIFVQVGFRNNDIVHPTERSQLLGVSQNGTGIFSANYPAMMYEICKFPNGPYIPEQEVGCTQ
jgi:hypothetical protein